MSSGQEVRHIDKYEEEEQVEERRAETLPEGRNSVMGRGMGQSKEKREAKHQHGFPLQTSVERCREE
jgi:hypothetical protein